MADNGFIIKPRRTGAFLALALIASPFVVHGTIGWFRTAPANLIRDSSLSPPPKANEGSGFDPSRDRKGADLRDPPNFRRIITIGPNAAEVVCALGACDRIVAVDKFCVFPAELRDRPRIGGLFDPDVEKIVTLKPDLLVLRGRDETIEQLARDRGFRLHFDKTDTIEGIESSICDIGRLLGRDATANKLIHEFQERVDAIRSRVADRTRPRVLVTLSRQPDRLANLLTAGKGTFTDEMISIAGGENIFGDHDMAYPQTNAESVIARRPDVIIEMMPELELVPENEAMIRDQWESLGSIPALENDRLHIITDENCQIPSPRYVHVIEKVSRLLHPEAWDE
jgi:iron complex transport system substrate-binding protein